MGQNEGLFRLNFFSLIQNVSDSNAAADISAHPSIAAIRKECVAAHFEFNHVSLAETELILQSLDPKATGHDQIPASVLRDGASVLAAPIARLINNVIDKRSVLSSREMMSLTSPNTGLYPS